MTKTLDIVWSVSLLAEASLLLRVWLKLRRQYTWFVLYLLADLVWALFMFGIWKSVPTLYAFSWVLLELVLTGGQFLISIEAIRKMNQVRHYIPRIAVLAVLMAAGISLWSFLTLAVPEHWPSSWLEPVNQIRAALEVFWGTALWLFFCLPCREGRRKLFEARHMLILAVYLFASGILMFRQNYEMAMGSFVPGWVFMLLNVSCFGIWILAVPRKQVAVPEPRIG